jgi:hypothetical protein
MKLAIFVNRTHSAPQLPVMPLWCTSKSSAENPKKALALALHEIVPLVGEHEGVFQEGEPTWFTALACMCAAIDSDPELWKMVVAILATNGLKLFIEADSANASDMYYSVEVIDLETPSWSLISERLEHRLVTLILPASDAETGATIVRNMWVAIHPSNQDVVRTLATAIKELADRPDSTEFIEANDYDRTWDGVLTSYENTDVGVAVLGRYGFRYFSDPPENILYTTDVFRIPDDSLSWMELAIKRFDWEVGQH